MRDPRIDKLANVLVNYSVKVKRDNVVRIAGSTATLPLVRAVYREVLLAGGHPLLRLHDDQCADIFFAHAKPKQLSYLNPLIMREVQTIDRSIGIWGDENTKSMTRVNPHKQAAVSQARKPASDLLLKRASIKGREKLRWVGTQYPCQASAQDAEMSLAQYEDFVFTAGLLHLKNPAAEWQKISKRQKRICDYLNKAKQMKIKTPQGTDIRLGIKGRRWINCDGQVNFPDGEVFTSPIENATEGVVCFSYPAVHGGREVHDIRLQFKAGKVVDVSAGKGEDFLIKMLDQDKEARILGELAIGTNYAIKQYTRNTLFDEKIGGTCHLAVGAAYPETGGKNKSALHWDMVCDLQRGGIIEVDGKVISRNGRFGRPDWPQPVRR
ncbi:MAG: aminopeptidase [Planctomycetota bacterium]|nr:MAG: aminopeptidase [Planctomycetota bacterium]